MTSLPSGDISLRVYYLGMAGAGIGTLMLRVFKRYILISSYW